MLWQLRGDGITEGRMMSSGVLWRFEEVRGGNKKKAVGSAILWRLDVPLGGDRKAQRRRRQDDRTSSNLSSESQGITE